MANVKFGTKHFNQPTPAGLNRIVRISTVIVGIFLGWMNSNDIIGENAQHIINSVGGLLTALSNGLTPFFGITIEPTVEVPASEVTAMETPKTT